MSNIAYVNGRYVPLREAFVHIEDRGYQLADGVYEYTAFYNRTLLDLDLHLARLKRSLAELKIAPPVSWNALPIIKNELIARNGREDGGVYLQVTRGVMRRDHPLPKQNIQASLTMTVCAPKLPKPKEIEQGVKVITQPDQRWARRDIKSIALLPVVLAKTVARDAGAKEAWLVEPDGRITEGGSSNAMIVDAQGTIVTHPADERILAGVTRQVVLELARKAGIKVIEKPFTPADVRAASEAFLTSTSPNVLPVVEIDGHKIGSGKPGMVTKKLFALYCDHVERKTGFNPRAGLA